MDSQINNNPLLSNSTLNKFVTNTWWYDNYINKASDNEPSHAKSSTRGAWNLRWMSAVWVGNLAKEISRRKQEVVTSSINSQQQERIDNSVSFFGHWVSAGNEELSKGYTQAWKEEELAAYITDWGLENDIEFTWNTRDIIKSYVKLRWNESYKDSITSYLHDNDIEEDIIQSAWLDTPMTMSPEEKQEMAELDDIKKTWADRVLWPISTMLYPSKLIWWWINQLSNLIEDDATDFLAWLWIISDEAAERHKNSEDFNYAVSRAIADNTYFWTPLTDYEKEMVDMAIKDQDNIENYINDNNYLSALTKTALWTFLAYEMAKWKADPRMWASFWWFAVWMEIPVVQDVLAFLPWLANWIIEWAMTSNPVTGVVREMLDDQDKWAISWIVAWLWTKWVYDFLWWKHWGRWVKDKFNKNSSKIVDSAIKLYNKIKWWRWDDWWDGWAWWGKSDKLTAQKMDYANKIRAWFWNKDNPRKSINQISNTITRWKTPWAKSFQEAIEKSLEVEKDFVKEKADTLAQNKNNYWKEGLMRNELNDFWENIPSEPVIEALDDLISETRNAAKISSYEWYKKKIEDGTLTHAELESIITSYKQKFWVSTFKKSGDRKSWKTAQSAAELMSELNELSQKLADESWVEWFNWKRLNEMNQGISEAIATREIFRAIDNRILNLKSRVKPWMPWYDAISTVIDFSLNKLLSKIWGKLWRSKIRNEIDVEKALDRWSKKISKIEEELDNWASAKDIKKSLESSYDDALDALDDVVDSSFDLPSSDI